MSKQPPLLDPFGRIPASVLPKAAPEPDAAQEERDRLQRVRWVKTVATRLSKSSDPADVFVGSALSTWGAYGGDLARDYFRTTKPKSHRDIRVLWREADPSS